MCHLSPFSIILMFHLLFFSFEEQIKAYQTKQNKNLYNQNKESIWARFNFSFCCNCKQKLPFIIFFEIN